jgi:proteasome lid subunit RPN8/RPN11
VKILQAALDEVHRHAAEGYPYEICGLLLGPPGGDRVTEARRARNTVTDRAHDRYEIDPRDQLRIQREADEVGLDVVGYYHSHPDHPARASITDAERSWAGPVYVIVSCEKGKVVDGNAFQAVNDGGPMRPVPMEVVA